MEREGLLVEPRRVFRCRTTKQDPSLVPSPNLRILKCEYFLDRHFKTKAEARKAIEEAIWIYNRGWFRKQKRNKPR